MIAAIVKLDLVETERLISNAHQYHKKRDG